VVSAEDDQSKHSDTERPRAYTEWADNSAPYGQDEQAWRRWAERTPILDAYEVRCTTIGPGRAVLVLDHSPIPLNPNGSLFGGITAAIADAAFGCVFMPSVNEGQLPATAHLSVEYHRPAFLPLTFDARVTNQGRSMLFCHVSVAGSDGRICNVCHGVMAIRPRIDSAGDD
jgi:uncharacterized protein (TIGR00369 family)